MHREVGEGQHALVGVGGKALARLDDVAHHAPAPFVGHVADMAHEAREGEPTIALHHRWLVAAAELMDLGRAVLEGHRGIVHGRRPGAQHGNCLSAQPVEVDHLAGMGAPIGRQGTHEVGHPPFAAAVLAGRQHDLARRQHLTGG
jgi:hypothetical protein